MLFSSTHAVWSRWYLFLASNAAASLNLLKCPGSENTLEVWTKFDMSAAVRGQVLSAAACVYGISKAAVDVASGPRAYSATYSPPAGFRRVHHFR